MGHLLYLMFRCDFDVMEDLESLEEFGNLNTPFVLRCQFRAHSVGIRLRNLATTTVRESAADKSASKLVAKFRNKMTLS